MTIDILELFKSKNIETNLSAIGWHKDSGIAAIYPPLNKEDVEWLKTQLIQDLPDPYTSILLKTNGLFLKKLTLYGLPVRNSERLDRVKLLPHSLIAANQTWRLKYKMENTFLMVGSKLGRSENTGIFMSYDGSIVAVNSEVETRIKGFEHLLDWSQDT